MEETTTQEPSIFQTKYDEFADALLGSLPEYTGHIHTAKSLTEAERLARFQVEVKADSTLSGDSDDFTKNPGCVLPGVNISNEVWTVLSDQTKKAIWEYVRILSICCFMEAGFSNNNKPAWMDAAMNDMKDRIEGADFQNIIKQFMTFFKSSDLSGNSGAGLEGLFENGFPKIPEKFLNGHLAKLAQEIVKDIKPEDLGISTEMMAECEKNPSRSFDILFNVFGNNPDVIQKTVQKIGKRLQQKFLSGAIRPQEIAREAEEMMKEFASNTNFVEMLSGLKSAFGFEDLDLARQAGKDGSARLSLARDRLRKKLEKRKQNKAQ
jgi:hypothetical protein